MDKVWDPGKELNVVLVKKMWILDKELNVVCDGEGVDIGQRVEYVVLVSKERYALWVLSNQIGIYPKKMSFHDWNLDVEIGFLDEDVEIGECNLLCDGHRF